MADIEPASDEEIAGIGKLPVHVKLVFSSILARIRVEQDRADKAEADLARLHAAIDEAEKHGPEVVHFIRAMAEKGGGNG